MQLNQSEPQRRPPVTATVRLAAAVTLSASAALAEGTPPGFARLADVAPRIEQDMRYASANNFTGAPVPGYREPQCWLRREAAQALARAQALAHRRGFDLVVYDCYRPKRAVAAFLAWSKDADESTKPAYYPRIAKSELFAQGYIAEHSTHSTGLAVDIGVKGWDFGAPFDYFDRRSWTKTPVGRAAQSAREKLAALMRGVGFENYPREWWHFTYRGTQGAESLDEEIR
jgi:zinc D-Ala-D-Ala dipeptidase